jgi:competence protein ComEC
MLFFWKEIPFLRFTFFLILGIVVSSWIPYQSWFPILLILFPLALLFKNKWVRSVGVGAFLIAVGILLSSNPPSIPVEKGQYRITATIKEVFSSGNAIAKYSKGNAQHSVEELAFIKDSTGLVPGMKCIADGSVYPVSALPDSEWKTFLEQKKISIVFSKVQVRSSARSTDWHDQYRYFCYQQRSLLHAFLIKSLAGKNEADLTLSLLMGGTTHLNKAMKEDFRGAGVMHIIAVSGMHLALLFVVVAELIFFIKRNRKIDWFTLVFSLLFIWTYAGLTGFSASVSRAAVMFTIMLFSTRANRGYHSWNSFFLSAFILILIDPETLYDLGFHLSYLAVAGIFLVQPLMIRIRFMKNPYWRYLWSAVVMSLAAQIMVSPYLIYLFGTFSPWFLISNLIMVPLSSVAVYLGITHVVLCWVPYLSGLIAWLTYYSVHALIVLADWFNLLWYFRMDIWECTSLYAILIFMLAFVYYRKVWFFRLAFCLSGLLCLYHVAGN